MFSTSAYVRDSWHNTSPMMHRLVLTPSPFSHLADTKVQVVMQCHATVFGLHHTCPLGQPLRSAVGLNKTHSHNVS